VLQAGDRVRQCDDISRRSLNGAGKRKKQAGRKNCPISPKARSNPPSIDADESHCAAAMARPIPVFPEVGSMITLPGCDSPFRSASSIIDNAMRSFMLPPGLARSSFTQTSAPAG